MKYDYRYTLKWMETNAHKAKGVEVGRDSSYVYFRKTAPPEQFESSSSSELSESIGSSSEYSESSSSSSNICGSDPSIDVTVTWTDGSVEKTVFGETWTAAENGATKSICPTTYACTTKYFTSGGDYNFRDKYERFYITTTYNTLFRMGAQIREQFQSPYTINSPLSFYTFCKNVDLIDDITHSWQRYYTTFFSFTDSYGTATTNDIIPTNFISSANIENNQFGFASDGDITIQWERGSGNWGCH